MVNVAPEGEAPKFVPNYKVKVMDKEVEIDEFIRDSIKDEKTQNRVKELYEKAHGLDSVKERFVQTRTENKELKTRVSMFEDGLKEIGMHYQRGDLGKVFSKLKIDEEKVLQWVLNKLEYQELPEDQRKIVDSQKEAEEKALAAEQEREFYRSEYEKQLQQARERDLMSELAKPDVKAAMEAFDGRRGQGAFMKRVAQHGKYVWDTEGVDLTAEQAIQEVLDLMGHQGTATAAQPAAPAQTQPASQPPIVPPKQTIPNVSGRPTSPAHQPPQNLAELKKLAAAKR